MIVQQRLQPRKQLTLISSKWVDMTGPSHVAMPPDNRQGQDCQAPKSRLVGFFRTGKIFQHERCFNMFQWQTYVTYSTASCCSFFNIYSIPWWYLKDSLDCHLGLDQTSTELPRLGGLYVPPNFVHRTWGLCTASGINSYRYKYCWWKSGEKTTWDV